MTVVMRMTHAFEDALGGQPLFGLLVPHPADV